MFGFANPHIDQRREPLDIAFNAAVMTMANAVLPLGWRVEESHAIAPHSLDDLNKAMRSEGMVVWGGASEYTIFGDKEHNCAFRAWHDAVHYRHQLPFTVAGEAAAAYLQVWALFQRYGVDDETVEWAALILTEVIGMALAQVRNGEFPVDQRTFVQATVEDWRRCASRLAIVLGEEGTDELAGKWLARAEWGNAL